MAQSLLLLGRIVSNDGAKRIHIGVTCDTAFTRPYAPRPAVCMEIICSLVKREILCNLSNNNIWLMERTNHGFVTKATVCI